MAENTIGFRSYRKEGWVSCGRINSAANPYALAVVGILFSAIMNNGDEIGAHRIPDLYAMSLWLCPAYQDIN